ncbi:MAG: ribose-phosphate pyrophosphokinae [Candidatus Midichloriaceae bacterium]|jgi:ribose-phosphate pyrophosphokinase|nr:ribose-phosphate pyrophosphokinae [Candidatus Midichloriaceae bacterium]
MILVANHSSLHLASQICELGGHTLISSSLKFYNSKEVEVSIPQFHANECVLIIGYDGDSNLAFIELLLHAQRLRDMGISKIHLCMPYMIYSRQRQDDTGSFGALSLVIKMINQCQFASVSIADAHDPETFSHLNNFVEIPHNSLFTDYIPLVNEELVKRYGRQGIWKSGRSSNGEHRKPILIGADAEKLAATLQFFKLTEYTKDAVFVSPDAGSKRRLKFFLDVGYYGIALNKVRKSPSEVCISGKCEDFNRKDCIILDDIVDSANTVCRAAEFLKKCGAQRIIGYISHNLLNPDAVKRIEDSPINYLVLSDTNAPKPFVLDCEKIKIASVAAVMAKHLQNII